MGSLAGRTAIVAGVASDVGEEWAKKLAAEGATVVVADADEENGRRVLAEIEKAGGTGTFCPAQASSAKEAGRLIDQAIQAGDGTGPAVVLLHDWLSH